MQDENQIKDGEHMKTRNMEKKNLFFLLLFVSVLFASLLLFSAAASHEAGHLEDTSNTQEQSLGNFNDNPTADNLLNIENPTVEQFNRLPPQDQASYLSQRWNNEFAVEFYRDPGNVGQNPEVDVKYFSGNGQAAESRSNIQENVPATERYFSSSFGKDYTFENVADDFFYDADKKTLFNNGKTLPIELLQLQDQVKGVKVVEEGFILIEETARGTGATEAAAEEAAATAPVRREISLSGDGTGTITYERGVVFMSIGEERRSFVLHGDAPADIKVNQDGSVRLTGPMQGRLPVNGRHLEYTNREGTLTIFPNGDFIAENAEIITPFLYVDGAAAKTGNTITAADHGSTTKGNTQNSHTVIIDRTTKVGVITQGQTKPDAVIVHIDTPAESFPAWSQFRPATPAPAGQEGEPLPQADADSLRAQARQLKPSSGDMKNNAEVWIRQEAGDTIVAAKGRVDVGFYADSAAGPGKKPLDGQPRFTGRNGISEMELRSDGRNLAADIRGAAEYSDQHQVIETKQDGSSVGLRRDNSNPAKDDIILVDCFQCGRGEAAVMEKSVLIAQQERNSRLAGIQDIKPVRVSISADGKGSLSYNFPASALGAAAEAMQENSVAVMARGVQMEVPCGENSGTCRLQFAVNEGKLGGFFEKSENGEIQRAAIQDIKAASGEELILVSEKNAENAVQLIRLVSQGINQDAAAELAGLQFDEDPALRAHLLRETGIDIHMLSNTKYQQNMQSIARERGSFRQFQQRLETEFNVVMDGQGRCVGGSGCETLQKELQQGGRLAYVWSAARISLARSERETAEALHAAGAIDDAQRKALRRESSREIQKMARFREGLEARAAERQQRRQLVSEQQRYEAQVKAGIVPHAPEFREAEEDADGLQLARRELQKERERIPQNIEELEEEIRQLQQIVPTSDPRYAREATFSGLSETAFKQQKTQQLRAEIARLQREDQDLQAHIQWVEDDLTVLTEEYEDMPHAAARLALRGGDPKLAREWAAVVEEIDPERGLSLKALAALQEGDLEEASLATRGIDAERQDLLQEVNHRRMDAVIAAVQEKHLDSKGRSQEKFREIAYKDSGIAGFLEIGSGAISAVNLLQLLPGEQLSYLEAREALDWHGYNQLRGEEEGSAIILSLLQKYQKEGLSPEESFARITGLSPDKDGKNEIIAESGRGYRTGYRSDGTLGETHEGTDLYRVQNLAWYGALKASSTGDDVSVEVAAAEQRQEIEREIAVNRGLLLGESREKLRVLAEDEKYRDTEAGAWAQGQLSEYAGFEGFLRGEFAEIGIEAVAVLDVIPFGTLAVLGAKGMAATKGAFVSARTARVADASADLARTVRIAETGITAGEQAAKAGQIRQASEAVREFLTKERYLSSQGRSLRDAVLEERQLLQKAEQAGDTRAVAERRIFLQEAETSFEGWKTGKQGQRAAAEVNTARRAALEARTAEETAAASQRLKNAEAVLEGAKASKKVKTGVFTQERGITQAQQNAHAEVRQAKRDFDAAFSEAVFEAAPGTVAAQARRLTEAVRIAENTGVFTRASSAVQSASEMSERVERALRAQARPAARQAAIALSPEARSLPEVTEAAAAERALQRVQVAVPLEGSEVRRVNGVEILQRGNGKQVKQTSLGTEEVARLRQDVNDLTDTMRSLPPEHSVQPVLHCTDSCRVRFTRETPEETIEIAARDIVDEFDIIREPDIVDEYDIIREMDIVDELPLSEAEGALVRGRAARIEDTVNSLALEAATPPASLADNVDDVLLPGMRKPRQPSPEEVAELLPPRQISGVRSAAGEIAEGRVVRRVIDEQAVRVSSLEQRVVSLPVDDINDVGRALDDLETVRLRIPEARRPQVRVGCTSPCAVQVLDNAGQEIPFEQLPARFGAAGEELQQQVRQVDSVMDEVAGANPQLSGVEAGVDELAKTVEKVQVEGVAKTLPMPGITAPEAAVTEIPPGVIDFRRPQAFTSEQLGGLEGRVLQLSDEGITVGDKTLREITLGQPLGAGTFGTVYCIQPDCAIVIKLPHADQKIGGLERGLQELRSEIEATQRLDEAGIAVARIHNPDPEAAYLIKDFVSGSPAGNLATPPLKLNDEHINALLDIRRKSLLHGIQLDVEHGGNMLWDARNRRFVIIDPAPSSNLRGDALWERTFFPYDPDGYAAFNARLGRYRLKEEAYILATERYLAKTDPAALAKFRQERAFDLRPNPRDYLPQSIIDDVEDSFNPVLRRVSKERDEAGRLVERATELDENAFRLREKPKEVRVLGERLVEEPLAKTAPERAVPAASLPVDDPGQVRKASLEKKLAVDLPADFRPKHIKGNRFELGGEEYVFDERSQTWKQRRWFGFVKTSIDEPKKIEQLDVALNLEMRVRLLEQEPGIYKVRDANGRLDLIETLSQYERGIREFTSQSGKTVRIRTDDIVETMFSYCRELGVTCGLAGSDAYRSIRLRKPTNLQRSSDLDILVPTEEELARVGYPEVGVVGVSREEALRALGGESLKRDLKPRQVQWAYDLKRRYSPDLSFELDPIGEGRTLYFDSPGETSRKLILLSDGKIIGPDEYITDALNGVLRSTKEPIAVRQPLRIVRFASEEKDMVIDAETLLLQKRFVNELFATESLEGGANRLIKLDKETTRLLLKKGMGTDVGSRAFLRQKLGSIEGEKAFQRSLSVPRSVSGDINRQLAKVFENTQDARHSLALLDDIGMTPHLREMGIDVNGLTEMIESARARGIEIPSDDIKIIINKKLKVQNVPPVFDDPHKFVREATGQDLSDEMINTFFVEGFAEHYNQANVEEKIRLVESTKRLVKERTTPYSVNMPIAQAAAG